VVGWREEKEEKPHLLYNDSHAGGKCGSVLQVHATAQFEAIPFFPSRAEIKAGWGERNGSLQKCNGLPVL